MGQAAVTIRPEAAADARGVREVHERAFGQAVEANVVERLRASGAGLLSLVAVEGREVVGHLLFSPAVIEGARGPVRGMGLAPMAVLPGRQRRGIGTALAEHGIAELRRRGCPFVIVLGHAEYYPRFGFVRASARGVRCQWGSVPDEAFMLLVLDEAAMAGVEGVARYRPEFDSAA